MSIENMLCAYKIIIVIMGSVKFILFRLLGIVELLRKYTINIGNCQSIALAPQQCGRKFMQTFVSVGIFGLQWAWECTHECLSTIPLCKRYFIAQKYRHPVGIPKLLFSLAPIFLHHKWSQIECIEFSCSAWFLVESDGVLLTAVNLFTEYNTYLSHEFQH